MIERDPPFFYDVSCDTCSIGEERIEIDDRDADGFMFTIGFIKAQGWQIRKDDDEWEHVCPACVGEGR